MKTISIIGILAIALIGMAGISMAEDGGDGAGDWSADSWEVYSLVLTADSTQATVTNGGNTDRDIGSLYIVQGTQVIGQTRVDEILKPGQSLNIEIQGGLVGSNIRLVGVGGTGIYAKGNIA